MEVDKQFSEICCDENILKQCEKLPIKVKLSLEKGKNIEFNDDRLPSFINDCINIENNIKDIDIIQENINKCKNDADIYIKFNFEQQLNLILENIKIFGNIFVNNNIIDSSIINKEGEKQELIIKWIKEKINKDNINFEKIFTMSLNGNSSKEFHTYCDNKGPTLTIIKTTENKIFGGFTPLNWDSISGSKIDDDAKTFIFSLNLMKKYDIINKEKYTIVCGGDGPFFGNCDFKLYSNMNKGVTYASNTHFLSNNNLELTGEKEYMKISMSRILKYSK